MPTGHALSAIGRRQSSRFAAHLVVLASWAAWSPVTSAQTTTYYSYDTSNRLQQAIGSIGTGVQFQYDAAGNLTGTLPINPTALTVGVALPVSLAPAAESALYTFTVAPGHPLVLDATSITTNPAGAPVTIAIYDASGAPVVQLNETGAAALDLSDLPPGTYTIIVTAPPGVTGSLQTKLVATNLSGALNDGAGGPLPPWALTGLASVLLVAMNLVARRAPA
ncbi:MAG: T9SS type A sorting domain-containing protein [Cyanobacteria bacterium SZAS LIN-2]|nr:T9SS type A sorting domain-containing protein [Cyanobacteria bacterium SZAS LIN-2]